MTEKVKVTPDALELVKLAITTTPPTEDDWKFRIAVRDRLGTLAHMMSEASFEATRAQRLLDSKYVKATLVSLEFEESSNRWIVTVKGDDSANSETETFRTERIETPLGREQAAKLPGYIDVECLFMLWLEPVSGSKTKTVRTLQHFVPHGKPTGRQSAQDGRHRTQPTRPPDDTVLASRKILEDPRLTPAEKVPLSRGLRDIGVTNPMRIPPEHLDAARALVEEIIAKREAPVTEPAEHFPGATYEE